MPNAEQNKVILEQDLELKNSPDQVDSSAEVDGGIVDELGGFIEGKVSELTPKLADQASGQYSDDTAIGDDDEEEEEESLLTEQELYKKKLLKSAPVEKEMNSEIKKILNVKKNQLESDVRKHRRTKNYFLLSEAIMSLRAVVNEIESLARMTFDQLKTAWLKWVHQLA